MLERCHPQGLMAPRARAVTHDFWCSIPVLVSHFEDYILFIKIAVLTAMPGRAAAAELGHHRGQPSSVTTGGS